MKKFLKIIGIAFAALFGITIIAGVIGAIFEPDNKTSTKEEKTKTEESDLIKIMNKLESVDDSTTFNSYFIEIEKIAKGNGKDAARADSIMKNQEFFKSIMQQKALKKWVDYAKNEFPKQFSEWDGSNRNLVEKVKDAMNDPKSFEHDKTSWEYGSGYRYIRVRMSYRGKNSFGALVKETITVKIDIQGNILEVE